MPVKSKVRVKRVEKKTGTIQKEGWVVLRKRKPDGFWKILWTEKGMNREKKLQKMGTIRSNFPIVPCVLIYTLPSKKR